MPEILTCTRAAGLRLVLYPLVNPSGWDKDTDLNIDGDGGDGGGANDYLRYRLSDGTWIWDLPNGHQYEGWLWSSDPLIGIKLPAETLVMHKLLIKEDWPNVKVALDIHQDNLTPDLPAGAYQYLFGDVSRYFGIIDEIRLITTILGGDFQFDRTNPNNVRRWDENGCIVFHDGSISDLAYRKEVRDSLTVETTRATELQIAIEVYMIWIRGLCELNNNR